MLSTVLLAGVLFAAPADDKKTKEPAQAKEVVCGMNVDIGIKPGGNSHQSETNLTEETPEATLPGARKGPMVSRKVRVP